MSNTIIKFISTIILAFTILINGIGNFIGVGDIIPTQPVEEDTTTEVTVTAPAEEVITNIDMVLAYYNEAYDSTYYVEGYQTMKLDGNITCGGTGGAVLNIAEPIIKAALNDNSYEIHRVPGTGDLTASDVVSAKAKYYGTSGETVIEIVLKEQVNGLGYYTYGPVSQGIGTPHTGMALDAIGAELKSGGENVVLTYKNPVIRCIIHESTGIITSGTWWYDLNVTATEFELSVAGLNGTFKDFDVTITFEAVI